MVQIEKYDEDSALVRFDTKEELADALAALGPHIRKFNNILNLIYLPAGPTSGDPLAQRGYIGCRRVPHD